MKQVAGTLLILFLFASAAVAQSAAQVAKDRSAVLNGWLLTVRTAEAKYKGKHGVYGNLAALRAAHLLDMLVFAPKNATTGPNADLLPPGTHFEVTAHGNGAHYRAVIWENLEDRMISVFADENKAGHGHAERRRLQPPPEDGPEGPLLSLPG